MPSQRASRNTWWWFLLLLLSVVAVWGAYWYLVATASALKNWGDRGTFGDMFGSLNALFAGLAFAGLIYAIVLQSQELSLQRQELQETRLELERTAVAQELTTKILREQLEAQRSANDREGFLRLLGIMEDRRRDRQMLWKHAKDGGKWRQLNEGALAQLEKVCRSFDTLGLFDRLGLVDRRLVDQFYSISFVRLYEAILGEYVQHVRSNKERGPAQYWELVQFYERVKHVPSNHPAFLGADDWTENPREPHNPAATADRKAPLSGR